MQDRNQLYEKYKDLPRIVVDRIFYYSDSERAMYGHHRYNDVISSMENYSDEETMKKDTYGDVESNKKTREYMLEKGILPEGLPEGSENHYFISLVKAFETSDYWLADENWNGVPFFRRDIIKELTPENIMAANLNFYVDVRPAYYDTYVGEGRMLARKNESRIMNASENRDSVALQMLIKDFYYQVGDEQQACPTIVAVDTVSDLNGAKLILGSMDVDTSKDLSPQIISLLSCCNYKKSGQLEEIINQNERNPLPLTEISNKLSAADISRIVRAFTYSNAAEMNKFISDLSQSMEQSYPNLMCNIAFAKHMLKDTSISNHERVVYERLVSSMSEALEVVLKDLRSNGGILEAKDELDALKDKFQSFDKQKIERSVAEELQSIPPEL